MTELDFLPATPDPTRPEREPRRCGRHQWGWRYDPPMRDVAEWHTATAVCARCGAVRDEARSRRGKSAARFGKDQERRIERVYGLRKVGEFGDAIDLLGKTTKWQSRATRGAIPAWLAAVDGVTPVKRVSAAWVTRPFAAMAPLFPDRMPVLIHPVVRHGLRTVDYIFVKTVDWWAEHGKLWGLSLVQPDAAFLVMRGETWLDLHGKEDAE